MDTAKLYYKKDSSYFSSARKDWIDILPASETARLLEIGCGNGDTGYYALANNKCQSATGIEINETAAMEAAKKITTVITGNVETLELTFEKASFDILVISEVLEHLVDPWEVLHKIRPYMKPNAMVFASSPNVSHYKVLLMLIKGEWRLESHGVMDRTHLRWFTPNTYKELFENCGIKVDSVGPVTAFGFKKKIFSRLTFRKLDHLLITQVNLRGHCI